MITRILKKILVIAANHANSGSKVNPCICAAVDCSIPITGGKSVEKTGVWIFETVMIVMRNM